MDKKNFGAESIQILWRIEEWFPDLSSNEKTLLKCYFDELLKFNKTINLISIKTIGTADLYHFADCVIACRAISAAHNIPILYDFGSGNGFPGLVYAILYPNTKVVLVENDERKVEFLKHVINTLKLSNAEALRRPVEKLPANSVNFAISRGFARITKALLMTRKCIAKSGIYFHMKSEEWATEVSTIPTQLCSFWHPKLLTDYKLPVGNIKYAIVTTEKTQD